MGLRTAIALLMLVGLGATIFVGHEALTPTEALQAGPVLVEIPAHDGILAIAGRLHQAGAIRSRVGFVMLAVFRGSARYLKAGEYEVDRGASTLGVLAQLEAGRVKQHVVLLPEGATVAELARALEADRLAPSAPVRRVAADPAFLSSLRGEAPRLAGSPFSEPHRIV